MANFAIERRFKRLGFDIIIGVDEAGRGPLAGPVVAGAVCLMSRRFKNRIDDSKKLTQREREEAFLEIIQKSIFALSVVDEGIIDALNILTATRLCMQEAINSLLKKIGGRGVSPTPYPDPERSEGEGSLRSFGSLSLRMTPRSCQKTAQGVKKICILVDGDIKLRISGYPVFNIIKGDRKSVTIASASILAKVSRDRIMSLYDKVWPQYGFLRHKGYPTSFHRDALRQFGPCPIHRLSFQMNPALSTK